MKNGVKNYKKAISRRSNWVNLYTFFKYPQKSITFIYTTNAIEGFNRQLRKVTKNKGVFPTDDSLLKMLYLAMMDITKNGLANAANGDKFIHSLKFSLRKD